MGSDPVFYSLFNVINTYYVPTKLEKLNKTPGPDLESLLSYFLVEKQSFQWHEHSSAASISISIC